MPAGAPLHARGTRGQASGGSPSKENHQAQPSARAQMQSAPLKMHTGSRPHRLNIAHAAWTSHARFCGMYVTRALTHNVTHALLRYVGVTHTHLYHVHVTHTYAYYHVYITRTGTARTSQTHSTSPSHTHTPRVHHAHTCASPTTPSLCTGCVPYVTSLWSPSPRTPPLLGVGSTPAASWDPPLLSNRHELRTPRMR